MVNSSFMQSGASETVIFLKLILNYSGLVATGLTALSCSGFWPVADVAACYCRRAFDGKGHLFIAQGENSSFVM